MTTQQQAERARDKLNRRFYRWYRFGYWKRRVDEVTIANHGPGWRVMVKTKKHLKHRTPCIGGVIISYYVPKAGNDERIRIKNSRS